MRPSSARGSCAFSIRKSRDSSFIGFSDVNLEKPRKTQMFPGRPDATFCAITRPAMVVKSSASISIAIEIS
jgi:hypothetical protein